MTVPKFPITWNFLEYRSYRSDISKSSSIASSEYYCCFWPGVKKSRRLSKSLTFLGKSGYHQKFRQISQYVHQCVTISKNEYAAYMWSEGIEFRKDQSNFCISLFLGIRSGFSNLFKDPVRKYNNMKVIIKIIDSYEMI